MLLLVKTHLTLSKDIQNHDTDFLHLLLRNKDNKLAHTCYSSFRYKDDVLSQSNSRIGDTLHLIYPNQLELKDTTETQKSASDPDIYLKINNGGRLDVLDISQLLTQKLLKQGYVAHRLKLSLQKFKGRYHNLDDHYEISISQMTIYFVLFT